MTNPTERTELLREHERSMRLVVIFTMISLVPFVLVAIYSGSMLLWTDAIDYVRALIFSFFGWRILRGVSRGSLLGFDYGTDKVQSLVGIGGSIFYLVLLVLLGAGCAYRLLHPVELEAGVSLVGVGLQLLSMNLDVFFWIKNKRLSQKLFSPVLEMQWRTDRASAMITFAMASGLLLSVLLRKYPWATFIDPAVAFVFIAYGAISFLPSIARDLESLTDKTLKEELQLLIDRRLAENFLGYSGFHGVRSRCAGSRVFIEIRLSFPPELPVGEAVKTVAALEKGIVADIPASEVSVTLCDPRASIEN